MGDFLAHVESQRRNSARSRNTRLAAIRSFFRFVAMNEPAYMLHCQKILAMPGKRYVRRTVEFLDRAEMDALLAAPDRSTWVGRRDHAILMRGPSDRVAGIGTHQPAPLRYRDRNGSPHPLRGQGAQAALHAAATGNPQGSGGLAQGTGWCRRRSALPDQQRDQTSRDALERIVRKHTLSASRSCSSLVGKRVSPHVLRHSTAMELLHHGVDQSVIALWLGHESVETTQIYMHADLRLKEKALARITAPASNPGRYRPDDKLLAFLEAL